MWQRSSVAVASRVYLLASAVVLAVIVLVWLPPGLLSEATYMTIAVAVAVLAWWGGASAESERRRVVRPVALGVVLSALGDALYYLVLGVQGSVPDVSVADIAWIGAYLALVLGLLRLVRAHQRGRRDDIDGLIDLAAMFVVALLLAWVLAIAPTIADDTLPRSTRLVWSLYPALDAALLALLLRTVATRRHLGAFVLLISAGVVCWLAADVAYLATGLAAGYSIWLDAGWLLGGLSMAVATWQPSTRSASDARSSDDPGIGPVRIAVALVPLLVPPAVLLAESLNGADPSVVPIGVVSMVLVALAYVRALRLFHDATEARAQVRSQARFSATLAANSSDAVVVLDSDGRIVRAAPQLATLVGLSSDAPAGRSMLEFVVPRDLAAAAAVFRRALRMPGQVVDAEVEVASPDGETMWLAVRLRDLRSDPEVGGVVCNLQNITPRKLAEAQLSYQAFHDELTGLPNRALFLDRLAHALRRTDRTHMGAAVAYLDLDGFKDVNDSLGHGAGDDLLREVARRLAIAVRAGDTVARLGGDEFAVLIEDAEEPAEEAERVGGRILAAVGEPIDLGERFAHISASLGLALADHLATATSLLRDSDIAMYEAKAAGRGMAVMFHPRMLNAAVARITIERELGAALEREQLHLDYHPVIALDTDRVVGFEARLRWTHPTLGDVPLETFLPLAERSGMLVDIGRFVLDESCGTVAAWQRDRLSDPPPAIAIEVSSIAGSGDDLLGEVSSALERTGLPASSLILEVTEEALNRDMAEAAGTFHTLRTMGVRIAVRDFGTGSSVLSYLREHDLDILKLDESFVGTIGGTDRTPPLVRGILELGNTLELEILAAGLTLPEQIGELHAQRCDLAQGVLFAGPLSATDAEHLLAGGRDGAEPSGGVAVVAPVG